MRRTSLFFFIEILLDDPDEQKSNFMKLQITLLQCLSMLAAASPLIGLSAQIHYAQTTYCGGSSAPGAPAAQCQINVLPLADVALGFAYALLLISFIELFQYFADGWVESKDVREEWAAERMLRRVIRWAFYSILAVTLTLSLTYLLAVVMWIVLGTISDLPRCVGL